MHGNNHNPDAGRRQVKPLISAWQKPTDFSKQIDFDGFGCSKNNSALDSICPTLPATLT